MAKNKPKRGKKVYLNYNERQFMQDLFVMLSMDTAEYEDNYDIDFKKLMNKIW